MNDDLLAAITRALEDANFDLENKILLCATNVNAETVAAWIDTHYTRPDDQVAALSVELGNGQAVFWFLDGARITPKKLRADLIIAGIRAVDRSFSEIPLVYCPPPGLDRAKAAKWN